LKIHERNGGRGEALDSKPKLYDRSPSSDGRFWKTDENGAGESRRAGMNLTVNAEAYYEDHSSILRFIMIGTLILVRYYGRTIVFNILSYIIPRSHYDRKPVKRRIVRCNFFHGKKNKNGNITGFTPVPSSKSKFDEI
jgi:hypothetical protein